MCRKSLLLMMFLGLCSCTTSSVIDEDSKLETYNKAMFEFNYQLDKKIIKPIAKGYKNITNKFVRNRVSSFFYNLEEPAFTINNLLQGEIKNTSISIGRFVINTTLGLFGTFDVASSWGLEKKKNTFDATMAKYCVPDGPFIVLPVVGPSTPRHAAGWAADAYLSPLYWALINSDSKKADAIVWGTTGLKYINLRAENMELLDGLEKSSVDFYEASKSAFMQNRKKFISLCSKPEEQEVPNYDFDFEEDFAE